MSDWYLNIEVEVRTLVKLLRNNGFNTTCSCGHEMEIEIDIQHADDGERLGTFLIENGVKEFRIAVEIDNFGGGYWKRCLTLHLKEGRRI